MLASRPEVEMTDGVLAAVIAACATVFASFLQIRASFSKEGVARAFPSSGGRRKSRTPLLFLFIMLGGAAVGGFALSQWLMERERSMQSAELEELQERIAILRRSESQLNESRAGTRAEIESGVLRRIGLEGVVVTASVAPCKPPLVVNTPALAPHTQDNPTQIPSPPATSGPPASTCTESDASPVMLCAMVPVGATVTDVEVFVRATESDVPWTTARVAPGAEADMSRFSEKPVEMPDSAHTKQVCESFASWSTERARTARMLVRYSL
jgi:hypothetical protein